MYKGKYVVLYDGEGVVEFAGDAAWPPLASSPGRLELNVTPSSAGERAVARLATAWEGGYSHK